MAQNQGLKSYKKYWEDQAAFMDKAPWSKDKILKLTVSSDYENHLKELGCSSHALINEDGKVILRLQVPYNYFELDDFQIKAIDLLGIDQSWIFDITFDRLQCTNLSENLN